MSGQWCRYRWATLTNSVDVPYNRGGVSAHTSFGLWSTNAEATQAPLQPRSADGHRHFLVEVAASIQPEHLCEIFKRRRQRMEDHFIKLDELADTPRAGVHARLAGQDCGSHRPANVNVAGYTVRKPGV